MAKKEIFKIIDQLFLSNICCVKGQTISKANYGVLNSPKKTEHKVIPAFVLWEN